jgi:TnpA family transposase
VPPRFLSRKDREQLNNFPANIEETDLITHFLLTPADHEQIIQLRTDTNRLGFAVLLCGLRYLGFFPIEVKTAPNNAVQYLAEQLNCDPNALPNYGTRAQTRREHQQWIMDYLGFEWMSRDSHRDLLDWLSRRALENDRPSVLLQQASERLYKQRFVRPATTTLERMVMHARQRANQLTYPLLGSSLAGLLQSPYKSNCNAWL